MKRASNDYWTMGVALSPDAKQLAWSAISRGLTVTDLKTRRPLWSAQGYPFTVAYSPDGRWLAFDSGGKSFRVVEARTGKSVKEWDYRGDWDDAYQFSPQGRYFASNAAKPAFDEWEKSPNDRGGEIEVRRTGDWKIERVLPLPNTSVLAFSPDEQSIVGVGKLYPKPFDLTPKAIPLRCFNLSTGQVKWELDALKPQLQNITDICYSPDGASLAVLAVLTGGSQLILLDASTGATTRTFSLPAEKTFYSLSHGLAFSPDGKRLFARGKDAVLVWDLE